MMRKLACALMQFAALMLALPTGWCCVVAGSGSNCCRPSSAKQPTELDSCCCCKPAAPAEFQTRSLAPGSLPLPRPICCCDRPPADKADRGSLPVIDAVPTPFPPVVSPAIVAVVPLPPEVNPAAFPARHVLHCVWLC